MNWQFPQGGIDPGEEPLPAAIRELQEETGICPSAVHPVAEHPDWLTYDFDRYTKERLGDSMDAYRGQKQKYFLMRFSGSDADITLAVPGHQPEFDAFEWVPLEATPGRVVGFKVPVYEAVVQEFAPIIARETGGGGSGGGLNGSSNAHLNGISNGANSGNGNGAGPWV